MFCRFVIAVARLLYIILLCFMRDGYARYNRRQMTPMIIAAAADDASGGRGADKRQKWLRFDAVERIISARAVDEVCDVVAAADDYTKKGGYVAGFVCYESAPAFDKAQVIRGGGNDDNHHSIPLAWFALCPSPPKPYALTASADAASAKHIVGKWRAETTKAEYVKVINNIHRRIRAGDVYQINHTWRTHARFAGLARSWFADIAKAQPSQWSFFVETDEWAVCSVSPECFFSAADGIVEVKPMKGTRPNKPGAAKQLAKSAKDRAENLMIVDMIRNDLARLPDAGNILAAPLLHIEEYPTVLQMTSTVRCRSNAGLIDMFGALFPCASVTGAPKIAAMRAIAELELSPRGVYCGACGWAHKDKARFNVAIRTAVINKQKGNICYGAGSGIVADSTGGGEWRECHNKTMILSAPPPPLLIETMRAENGEVALLAFHLRRLTAAAKCLGFAINRAKVKANIMTAALRATNAKLRLTMNADGKTTLQTSPPPKREKALKLCILPAPSLLFCRHKTNRRAGYDKLLQKARAAGFDDALLVNKKGEITETCIANICANIGGEWLTPPEECGLLPGVLRAKMIQSGKLKEKKINAESIPQKLYRLNAVRGMQKIIPVRAIV